MNKLIAIIYGSESDRPLVNECVDILHDSCKTTCLSAHRDPVKLVEYVKTLKDDGFKVVIAIAGMAAALPGVVASHTDLPVIGVPADSGFLGGLDALLSICQMPSGVPVATMGIGKPGARNAAHLALRILKLLD